MNSINFNFFKKELTKRTNITYILNVALEAVPEN